VYAGVSLSFAFVSLSFAFVSLSFAFVSGGEGVDGGLLSACRNVIPVLLWMVESAGREALVALDVLDALDVLSNGAWCAKSIVLSSLWPRTGIISTSSRVGWL
jgi:hypothetical protein